MFEAVQGYLKDPASNLSSPSSRDSYWRVLMSFDSWAGSPDVSKVTERQIVDWITSRRLAPGTQAAYVVRFQGFFSWAHWRGLIPANPAAHLKRALPGATNSRPVKQHHWLDTGEISKVLESTRPGDVGLRDEVLLRLGFTAGLRRQELVNLTWGQVDLPRQQITFVGKGRKLAQVYITPRTLETLRRWYDRWVEETGAAPLQKDPVLCRARARWGEEESVIAWGEGLTHSGVAVVIRRARGRSGVDFSAHDMRRSFAGMMYEKVGLEKTSKALRHSNLGVTERYLESRTDAAFLAVREAGVDV